MTVWLKLANRAGEDGERTLLGRWGETQVYVVPAELGALMVLVLPDGKEVATHYRTMDDAKSAAFRRIAGGRGEVAWGAFP